MVVKRGSAGTARAPSLCTLILGVLAGLFTTVCFLIDVIFVAVVRDRIRDLSNDVLYVEYGNGVSLVFRLRTPGSRLLCSLILTLPSITGVDDTCGCDPHMDRNGWRLLWNLLMRWQQKVSTLRLCHQRRVLILSSFCFPVVLLGSARASPLKHHSPSNFLKAKAIPG